VLRLAAPFPDQGNVADLLGLLFTGAFREGALWESPPASGDGGGRWELVGARGECRAADGSLLELRSWKVAAGCWGLSLNNFSQKVGKKLLERAGLEDAERDLKCD